MLNASSAESCSSGVIWRNASSAHRRSTSVTRTRAAVRQCAYRPPLSPALTRRTCRALTTRSSPHWADERRAWWRRATDREFGRRHRWAGGRSMPHLATMLLVRSPRPIRVLPPCCAIVSHRLRQASPGRRGVQRSCYRASPYASPGKAVVATLSIIGRAPAATITNGRAVAFAAACGRKLGAAAIPGLRRGAGRRLRT